MSPQQWEDYAEELEALLGAHRSAQHIFLPSRAILQTLLTCNFIGRTGLITLAEIRNKYVELEALRARLHRVAVIYDPARGHLPITNNVEKSISTNDLMSHRVLAPFRLVVENLKSDGNFWHILFDVVAHHEFGSWGSPKFELSNGGGLTIADVISYHSGRREPFFCIVDSDRRSPYAPLGDTASAARQVLLDEGMIAATDNGLSSCVIYVGFHALEGREAENLIPMCVVSDILAEIGSANFRNLVRLAPSYPDLNAPDCDLLKHYDFKTSKLVPLTFHCVDEQVYFAKVVARVGNPPPCIREKLLDDFVLYFSGKNSMQRKLALSKQLLSGPHVQELRDLFWGVFSLGCVPPSRWF